MIADVSEPAQTKTDAMRSDVRRNREALLAAARELFGATSDDVPMYEVARRAGVGQATLYRHFPDRGALASALAQELFVELATYAAHLGNTPDAFHLLLERVIQTSTHSVGVTKLIYDRPGKEPQLAALHSQLKTIFAIPLNTAKAAGSVRPDLMLDDVLLILRMVQGALDMTPPDQAQRSAVSSRAFALISNGTATLTPPCAPTSAHS